MSEWANIFHGYTYDKLTGKIFDQYGKDKFTSLDRGYNTCMIGYRKFYAHRVAWFLFYGVEPKGEIDHISGVRNDNRIVNLRDVSKAINNRNKAKAKSSASGITGIYKVNRKSCWVPQVSIGNKSKSLGATPCLGVAIKRRNKAERELGFHENHGRTVYEKH